MTDTDDLDFDLDKFLQSAYDNAVAIICDQRAPCAERVPNDIETNPLMENDESRKARTWASFVEAPAAAALSRLGTKSGQQFKVSETHPFFAGRELKPLIDNPEG